MLATSTLHNLFKVLGLFKLLSFQGMFFKLTGRGNQYVKTSLYGFFETLDADIGINAENLSGK